VARRDVVIDAGLDPLSFAIRSRALRDGDITFTTLPVKAFAEVDGEDVNLVNLEQIRATVRNLLNPDDANPRPNERVDSANPPTGAESSAADDESGSSDSGSGAPEVPASSIQGGGIPCVK
jgi:hypothetical protein